MRPLPRVFGLYLLAAIVLTWPLVLHPFGRLAAPVGPGDPYLNLWILGWDLRAISSDPLALLTGRVFDANIFFPAEQTLAYSDHLLLQAVIVWPLWAVTHDIVFCYNALLFLSFLASAWTMYSPGARGDGLRGGRMSRGFCVGLPPVSLRAPAAPPAPVALLPAPRVPVPAPGDGRPPAQGRGVARGVRGAAGDLVGVLGRDRRNRARRRRGGADDRDRPVAQCRDPPAPAAGRRGGRRARRAGRMALLAGAAP